MPNLIAGARELPRHSVAPEQRIVNNILFLFILLSSAKTEVFPIGQAMLRTIAGPRKMA